MKSPLHMHKFIFAALLAISAFTAEAATDSSFLQKAEAAAATQHKYILLNFSGSDWCIPCMKMKKAVFSTDTFHHYAAENLLWMNADFPRNKKNISKQQSKQNEELADQYNKKGSFPYTILLDEKGNIIKSWDGFPNLTAEEFIKQIDAAVNDNRKGNKTP
jgi:thioredoxin-related protein